MSGGSPNRTAERQAEGTTLWELVKGGRRFVAYVRKIDAFDALELRYEMNGRFLHSQMYRGPQIEQLRPDAEAKRQKSILLRWSEPASATAPQRKGSPTFDGGIRRERRIKGVLGAVARQRVVLVLQPGNVLVVEHAVDTTAEGTEISSEFMRRLVARTYETTNIFLSMIWRLQKNGPSPRRG